MTSKKTTNNSPLAGLKEAVERGEVELKPLPPDQRQRMDLVRECRSLAQLLHDDYKVWDVRVSEHADGSFGVRSYNCRDERYVSLFPDGRVALTTWQTSHHNGDPYGEETKFLDPVLAHKELEHTRNWLEAKAVDCERDRQAKAAEKREHDMLLKNVRARLRNK
jgi:hypothetical protein